MEDFYSRSSRSLSGGQRQKLNILLSILHNPELVILDEISTGLDLSAREEIIEFTKKVLKTNNITAILISHHMEEIEALCDKVVVLNKGKIVEILTFSQIEAKYGSLSKLMRKIIQEGNKKPTTGNTKEFVLPKKPSKKAHKASKAENKEIAKIEKAKQKALKKEQKLDDKIAKMTLKEDFAKGKTVSIVTRMKDKTKGGK